MARPGRTIDAAVVIGRPEWAVELTPAVNELAVNGTVEVRRPAVLGSRATEAVAVSASVSAAIGTAYAGPILDVLRTHADENAPVYACLFDPVVDACYVIEALLGNRGVKDPSDDLITESVDLPQGALAYAGISDAAVTAFTFVNGSIQTAIGVLAVGDVLFLAVTEYTAGIAAAADISVGGEMQSVGGVGVWKIGTRAAAAAAAVVAAAHALAGDQTIKGYVLVAQEMGID